MLRTRDTLAQKLDEVSRRHYVLVGLVKCQSLKSSAAIDRRMIKTTRHPLGKRGSCLNKSIYLGKQGPLFQVS